MFSERQDGYGQTLQTGSGEGYRVPDEEDSTFPQRSGIVAVRGCMVLHIRDEDGAILSDPAAQDIAPESRSKGTRRIFRVALDPAQYAMDAISKRGTGIYQVRCFGETITFAVYLL
jgi:hypothetical protein